MSRFTQIPTLGPVLDRQIKRLIQSFPCFPEIEGVILTGSLSRGEATYRSDIDLLIVLKKGPLTYSRVKTVRNRIEAALKNKNKTILESPLPVQMTVVLSSVFDTKEPAMRSALKTGLVLLDPSGNLKERAA